ncbi:MAG TPA: J domain-containing protein [Streptosporangiaceae bacterium]
MNSPFEVLGVPVSAELTDDDIRSAWRRIAAATHPDRADGGDPAAFAAAAAAYTMLRTPAGRGEALADVSEPGGRVRNGPVPRTNWLTDAAATTASRIRHGRTGRLAVRLLAAGAAGAVAVIAVGWQPASIAIITGALTWLLATGRADLASPR